MGLTTKQKQRIWKGDIAVLEEIEVLYRHGTSISIIEWASALYSFRGHRKWPEWERKLHYLKEDLCFEAERLKQLSPAYGEYKDHADRADVLSTILLYLDLQDAAQAACEAGLGWASHLPRTDHSYALLLLTCAQIHLGRFSMKVAQRTLRRAERQVVHIEDAQQRNRVYRKLGMLYRKLGKRTFWHGWKWGMRAVFQRKIPLAVRIKSVAALVM